MTGTEVGLIIGQVAVLVTAIAGARVSFRNSRKIEEVHKSTNGKMDRLLEVTGASEKAKGVIEGREQQREKDR